MSSAKRPPFCDSLNVSIRKKIAVDHFAFPGPLSKLQKQSYLFKDSNCEDKTVFTLY